ncbi:MAG: alpha-galactosidase, partial [Bacteroidetes bacterium]
YYGDHVELSDDGTDFASSFGIGAVLGTKFTWPKDNPTAEASYLLTPEKEIIWKKWFSLYNEKMLSKEPYLGNLYDIGFDKPETHAIQKGNTIYYAFYAENWKGKIELRGLGAGDYKVYDYFNEKDYGKVSSESPQINVEFSKFLLLEVSPE